MFKLGSLRSLGASVALLCGLATTAVLAAPAAQAGAEDPQVGRAKKRAREVHEARGALLLEESAVQEPLPSEVHQAAREALRRAAELYIERVPAEITLPNGHFFSGAPLRVGTFAGFVGSSEWQAELSSALPSARVEALAAAFDRRRRERDGAQVELLNALLAVGLRLHADELPALLPVVEAVQVQLRGKPFAAQELQIWINGQKIEEQSLTQRFSEAGLAEALPPGQKAIFERMVKKGLRSVVDDCALDVEFLLRNYPQESALRELLVKAADALCRRQGREPVNGVTGLLSVAEGPPDQWEEVLRGALARLGAEPVDALPSWGLNRLRPLRLRVLLAELDERLLLTDQQRADLAAPLEALVVQLGDRSATSGADWLEAPGRLGLGTDGFFFPQGARFSPGNAKQKALIETIHGTLTSAQQALLER